MLKFCAVRFGGQSQFRGAIEAGVMLMGNSDTQDDVDFCLISKNNCSMSVVGRRFALGVAAVVCIGISLGLSIFLRAWPILPFMGIELTVLSIAFWYINQHVNDNEKIYTRGNKIVVERIEARKAIRFELDRYWARVFIKRGEQANSVELILRSRGNEVSLGKCLAPSQRIELGRQLSRAFGN